MFCLLTLTKCINKMSTNMSPLINIALPDYNSILVMFDAINTYLI